MNIQSDKSYLVFKKQTQYGAMYSIGLSKKNQSNGYDKGYIGCKFKNGVDLENKANIYIKEAWLTFYLDKNKKTVPYIFINEFSTVEKAIENSKEETEQKDTLSNAVEEFSQEADLSELEQFELPF